MKPPVTLCPDDRWNHLVGTYGDLVANAAAWRIPDCAPEPITTMLGTSRELFAHSYFRYEFLPVAVTWSLLAVEAALRDVLRSGRGPKTPGLRKLIGKAKASGLLTAVEADALDAGRQLRDRLVHTVGAVCYTPGMAAEMLEASHAVVASLYARSATASEG